MRNFALALYSLWIREIIRFFRQRNRVVGALGQPLLFWLFMGTGLNASFQPKLMAQDVSYMEYFYPGILMMILLFTSIFSTFSIIEDRNEGFLQGILVSPAPRLSIILGKVFGGASIALIQALLFLIIAPFLGLKINFLILFYLILFLFLISVSLTSFGFCLAWRMDSMQGFHALMMLILLPMWFLSGAFFPLEGLPAFLQWLMRLNPLTYGLAAVRRLLYWDRHDSFVSLPSLEWSIGIMAGFGLLTLAINGYLVSKKRVQ